MGNVRPKAAIQRWVDQGTQYQLFPEEYFSGTDVTVYFGDTWVDDIVGLEFSLAEKVLPIYGYASHTFDDVARGTRMVQGRFTIAFREAGYLYSILERLAQKPELKPQVAYLMDKEKDASFTGKAKQRIEDLLAQGVAPVPRAPDADPWNLSAMNMPTLRLGDQDTVRIFNWDAVIKKCSDLWFGTERVYNRGELTADESDALKTLAHQAAEIMRAHRYDEAITPLSLFWMRLDLIAGDPARSVPIAPESVKWLKELSHAAADELRHGVLEFEGPVQLTKKHLAQKGFYRGEINGTFDDALAQAIIGFQKQMGIIPASGELNKETRTSLFYATFTTTERIARNATPDPEGRAGSNYRWAQYEAEIWGRGDSITVDGSTMRNDLARKYQPFFYRSTTADLQKRGFDIFVTYGPLAEDMEMTGGKDAKLWFNTTVKAIRNVQITDVSTMAQSTDKGQVIMEVYSFMAEDLD